MRRSKKLSISDGKTGVHNCGTRYCEKGSSGLPITLTILFSQEEFWEPISRRSSLGEPFGITGWSGKFWKRDNRSWMFRRR